MSQPARQGVRYGMTSVELIMTVVSLGIATAALFAAIAAMIGRYTERMQRPQSLAIAEGAALKGITLPALPACTTCVANSSGTGRDSVTICANTTP